MSVESKIVTALSALSMPVVANVYTGTATTYITFNFPKDSVAQSGDNTPIIDEVAVQVHLFTPNKPTTLKKQIRAKLFKAGFTYADVTRLYESDTKLNHIIFECEILEHSENRGVEKMKTGLKYPYIAQYNESTGVYSNGFSASKGVEFTTAPAYNSASYAGDDQIVKQTDKFKNSAISLKVTNLPIAAATVMFGHVVSGMEVKNNTSDEPNYVGLGIVTTTVNDDGADTYTAMIVPKVKFMEGGNTFTSNGDTITINAPQITGMSYADINGDWYIEKTFATEALALEYVKTYLGILAKCTTPTPSVAPGTYATTQSVTLTAGAGETIKYTTNGLTPSSTVGTTYSAAISVAASTMIRAIAFKSGSIDSEIANLEYTITA